MKDIIPLGQFIRQSRDEKDLSLRELAQKISCSIAFLSDVELGRRYLPEDFFPKVAKSLGVSIEELRERDTRLPTDGLRNLAQNDPRYVVAFRTVIESNVSAKDLLNFAVSQMKGTPAKKKS